MRKLLLLIFAVAACGCFSRPEDSGRLQAIVDAREKVITLASQIREHVPIDQNQLRTTNVEGADDGGWYVTLEAGACKYIVYSKPGVEIDVAGSNEECIRPQDQWGQSH